MFMRKMECPNCKKIMFSKSVSFIRCNKCGQHKHIRFYKRIYNKGEEVDPDDKSGYSNKG